MWSLVWPFFMTTTYFIFILLFFSLKVNDKKLLDPPPTLVVPLFFSLFSLSIVTCTHKKGWTVQNRTIDYNMGKRMFEQEGKIFFFSSFEE